MVASVLLAEALEAHAFPVAKTSEDTRTSCTAMTTQVSAFCYRTAGEDLGVAPEEAI